MECPRCAVELRRRRLGNVGFQRCPKCGGSWYGAGKLRVLKDRASHGDYRWLRIDLWKDRAKFRAGKQERLACPKDGATMTTVRYGDSRIHVDSCVKCRGAWLDAKEYDKILRFLDTKVDSATVGDYVHDLRDEVAAVLSNPKNAASELADVAKVLHLLELRFVVQHKNIASALRSAARGVPGA